MEDEEFVSQLICQSIFEQCHRIRRQSFVDPSGRLCVCFSVRRTSDHPFPSRTSSESQHCFFPNLNNTRSTTTSEIISTQKITAKDKTAKPNRDPVHHIKTHLEPSGSPGLRSFSISAIIMSKTFETLSFVLADVSTNAQFHFLARSSPSFVVTFL